MLDAMTVNQGGVGSSPTSGATNSIGCGDSRKRARPINQRLSNILAVSALCAALFPTASAQSTLPPIPAYITCSRFACAVELWGRGSGVKVETRSRAEAEKLVAILIENSGRDYVFGPDLWQLRQPVAFNPRGRR